uniref:ANK_REP_REGION domain-containing protein n=1 Tax=Macrostomum lignano TaxID=282301 RepID=A0A1I8G001_9PLAT
MRQLSSGDPPQRHIPSRARQLRRPSSEIPISFGGPSSDRPLYSSTRTHKDKTYVPFNSQQQCVLKKPDFFIAPDGQENEAFLNPQVASDCGASSSPRVSHENEASKFTSLTENSPEQSGNEVLSNSPERLEIGNEVSSEDLPERPEGRRTLVDEVNTRDNSLKTPLMHAAANDHPDVVVLLHNMGADVNKKDRCEQTALTHAAIQGSDRCIEALINLKAEAHTVDYCGNTPLIWAARENQSRVVVALDPALDQPAYWSHRGEYHMSALQWAVYLGHRAVEDTIKQW